MAYLSHTAAERAEMLARIGAKDVGVLFEAVPAAVRYPKIELPEPLSELELMQELRAIAEDNLDVTHTANFLGAGAYQHFIPAVVGHLTGRAEFYTAYTPYQPEISQGTLQAIFEYQSMICALTGMEVSNASHYDGATALAEAVITAVSAGRGKRRKVVLSPAVHPEYRETLRTYAASMELTLVGDESLANGPAQLAARVDADTACLVVQNPDFFGRIADLAPLAQAAHAQGALLVVVAYPIALGMLKAPGDMGADIVVGEGQPLGNALNFGGPYLGYFACKQDLVRRMSGRLVGQTVDVAGQRGFVLTLSTREQHIRREKATSNICTNQGLNALAAAIYMAALGKCGLAQVAQLCYHRAHYAARAINGLPRYQVDLKVPFFNEFVVRCPRPVAEINDALLAESDIIGGLDLESFYPQCKNQMLVCVTEMNARDQIDRLAQALREVAP